MRKEGIGGFGYLLGGPGSPNSQTSVLGRDHSIVVIHALTLVDVPCAGNVWVVGGL